MIDDLRAALAPVADALEALGVDYRVGGPGTLGSFDSPVASLRASLRTNGDW